MAELKQSINTVQINGIIAEMNLKETTKEQTLKKKVNGSDLEKKVTCKVIEKVEFSNPTFVVESNGKSIPVEFFGINFGVAEKALDDNGEIVDNKNFKSLETIMSKYVTKANAKDGEEPTRVKVSGKLGLNEYPSFKRNSDGEFISMTQIIAFGITSTGVAEEDSADAEISGVIKTINHETKDDNETGRLLVDFISFGYNGVAEPYKFVVEEDLAKDFEDFYELGSSVKIYYEITTKQVGNVRKSSEGGFGRRDAKITSGYTVTEYSVFRGEEPFEEDNEYFVDVETVKKALAEREAMKDEKIANALKKAQESSTAKSSPKGASATKSSPFGASGTTKKQNPFA